MTKIVENITNNNIELQDLGITIPANSTYDLSYKWSFHLEQSTDLETNIVSGSLLLIKSLSPKLYYNATQAVRILQNQVDVILAAGSPTEVLATDTMNNLNWVDLATAPNPSLGALYSLSFVEDSNGVADKWLSYLGDGNMNSNEVPAILPWKSRLVGATFITKQELSDLDLDVYSVDWIDDTSPKNLMWQWQLRNTRAARITSFPTPVIFEAGDKLSIYCTGRGKDPKKTVFTLYLKIIEENIVEEITTWSGNVATTGAGTD